MDRASTFSDPGIIRRLQTEFIPYAGNVADLQWNRTPAAKWFLEMAQKVNDRPSGGQTSQGFYVAGADGSAYGFNNNRSVQRVHQLMNEGLRAFSAAPSGVSTEELRADWTVRPPAGTSVVRVFSRITPLPIGANPINNSLGRDHMWITRDDVRALLNIGTNATPMPRQLTGRMVRFHLMDNVRGEPDMWLPDQVRKASFSVRRIEQSGPIRVLRFSGEFAQRRDDNSRGHEGKIEGEIRINVDTLAVVRFRAYSEGEAWGQSRYTGFAPSGRFPLVIAMIEADDEVSKVVPPQAIRLGREYYDARFGR